MFSDDVHKLRRPKGLKTFLNDRRILIVFVCSLAVSSLYIHFRTIECYSSPYSEQQLNLIEKYRQLNLSFDTFNNLVAGKNNEVFQYNRSTPLIFISGVDGYSGGPYLRGLLDSHSDISCGHERNFISHLLKMRQKTLSTKKERTRLGLAGVGPTVFGDAIAAYILEVFTRQVQPAEYLCNEDFYSVADAYFLAHLFPQSRFLLVVRDGRAVAHSKMPKNHTTAGFNTTLFEEHLKSWNMQMQNLVTGCQSVGKLYCMMVYYEHLLLHPIQCMNMILTFLNIPTPHLFHNKNFVFFNKIKDAMYQGNHPSTELKLSGWFEYAPISAFLLRNTTTLLAFLGYINLGHPPDYQRLNQKILSSNVIFAPEIMN